MKDNFKAKGLKEAGDALDIMRLPPEAQYGYNRYLDYLHYKASEIFSLKSEAEFKVREDIRVEVAKNAILKGADNQFISDITNLSIAEIQKIRDKMNPV